MVDRLRKWFAWYKEQWAARLVLAPIILTLPPLTLAAGQIHDPIGGFFAAHKELALLCAFWPALTVVFQALTYLLDAPPPATQGQLMMLLKIINGVVGSKISRFGSAARKAIQSDSSPRAGDIFLTITQPDRQIEKIVEGVYYFFYGEARTRGVDINVALAIMGPKYIEGWLCHHPGDYIPASPIIDLQVDHCGFSRAKQKRQMIIVESIKQESRKPPDRSNFAKTTEQFAEDDGSMICFPVIHPLLNEVPYVLSIVATRPKYFRLDRQHRKSYEYILNMFRDRILLEHGLKLLKERAVNEQDPAEHTGR